MPQEASAERVPMSRCVGGRVRFGAQLLLFAPAWFLLAGTNVVGQTSTVRNGTMPRATRAAAAPAFEVASIRENKSDEHARSHIISDPHKAGVGEGTGTGSCGRSRGDAFRKLICLLTKL